MSVLEGLSPEERELAPPAPPPQTAGAMKAVLTDDRFSDPNWIYERKLDGIRCIAIRSENSLKLLSRNDLAQNDRYPELVEALEAERCRQFAVDGEVVAFQGSETSFALLAERHQHWVPVFLYVFDVLWLEGHDVRRLPLRTRKRLLRGALQFHGNVRWTQYRNRDGEALFREACRKGWEGLMAKRADSPYVSTRSKDWLKFKCAHGQELVIGGYTDPRGSRVEFGALLLGYYRDGRLEYAGKVGTGFDTDTLHELGAQLRELKRTDPPFADPGSIKERHVTWAEPKLVAEVGFTEWTRDGRLRHPRFLGLRDDKDAREVVREG
ncbi:MAG TPA: non-homologous end-joining DNA ligase [Solirubrobacteraceae bacterium]|nr:non-homologous end-joining DNA ligase [Solirubrobacteraceae bacterium]